MRVLRGLATFLAIQQARTEAKLETRTVSWAGDNIKAAKAQGNQPMGKGSQWTVRTDDDDTGRGPLERRRDLDILPGIPEEGEYDETRAVTSAQRAWAMLEEGMSAEEFTEISGVAATAEIEVATVEAEVVGTAALETVAVAGAESALLCPLCFAVAAAVGMVATVVAAPLIISAEWDKKRERFTQDTVAIMMAAVNANANASAVIAAAACYNMAYDLSHPENALGLVSRKFTSGLLHTDYDCMYLRSPNNFWTRGDGGYQNVAFSYHTDKCTYDGNTGDLNC